MGTEGVCKTLFSLFSLLSFPFVDVVLEATGRWAWSIKDLLYPIPEHNKWAGLSAYSTKGDWNQEAAAAAL